MEHIVENAAVTGPEEVCCMGLVSHELDEWTPDLPDTAALGTMLAHVGFHSAANMISCKETMQPRCLLIS